MFLKLLLVIIIGLLLAKFIYYKIINNLLIKNNELSYDFYMDEYFQTVSKNSYYMNYGLWDANVKDLRTANLKLIDFMFEKMDKYKTPGMKILDVGCGYGEQDLAWLDKIADPAASITAIDISEKQIQFAQAQAHAQAQANKAKQLHFAVGNALTINETYKTEPFDMVVSLESAFHYADRPKFFQNANAVLQPTGVFILSDLVVQPDYKKSFLNKLLIKLFLDTFHVPRQNLITPDEWQQSLIAAGFEIIECTDITEQTFRPFYNFFVPNYCKQRYIPGCIASLFNQLLANNQPLSYQVAVCKRGTPPDPRIKGTPASSASPDPRIKGTPASYASPDPRIKGTPASSASPDPRIKGP